MDTPTMKPVPESSWIAEIGYSASTPEFRGKIPGVDGFLLLKTKRGETYGYLVPRGIYGLLLSGISRGKAFSRIVRGRYPVVKLPEGMV